MKRIISMIAAALTVTLLCSCSDDFVVHKESKRPSSTGDSWTVMLYMCGSTMEEEYGAASRVLSSLAYNLPENINVTVETGGSRIWQTKDVYVDYLQDFEVVKNGIRLIDQSAAANMGDPETLRSFFKRSMESYPADHYIGVIWDHGAGPLGGAAFDSNYSYDSLTLKEISSALGGLNSKLDMIGFDAGLMSNIETASALSLYTDYLVASEDIMPMSGWDYGKLFGFLSENPGASMPEVGKVICDGVAEKASEQERDMISMAVCDLSKASTLSLMFEGLGGMMDSSLNDLGEAKQVAEAIKNMEFMGGNSPWEGYSNLVDLAELVDKAGAGMSDIHENIKAVMDEVVVYRCMSAYHSGAGGLAVYYPEKRTPEKVAEYRDICMSNSYMAYIEKTSLNMDIENRQFTPEDCAVWQPYNDLAYENVMTAAPDMTGKYMLSATHPEVLTFAAVNFYMYDKNNAGYLYLGSDYNTEYDEKEGVYSYEFSGRLPMLNSTPVSMYRVSSGAEYDMYSIPVVYEGSLCNIRVIKSKSEDNAEYRIIGLWRGVDPYSGMAQREYKKLSTGDVIIPIYRVYGKDESSYIEGSKIRIGFGGAKITEKPLKDGDYIVSYTAEDIFGEEYECATNNLEITNGSIKIMDY